MADTDDDGFIGMPPGIFESGTFKLPPKPERPRVEREEIVFVPTVPGMPVPAPVEEPEVAAPAPAAGEAAPEAEAAPVSYETQRAVPDPADSPYAAPVVPTAAPEAPATAETPVVAAAAPPATPTPSSARPGWTLVLADGREVAVTGTLLVGRNPAAFDAWPGAVLLPVDDTTHSVSKTHAVFELDDSGLWVHDLNSTNGVWVVHGEDVTEVSPGRRVGVHSGSTVELGDYVLSARLS